MIAETLFDEPLFVAAAVDGRFARRRKLELRDLIDEPWVLAQVGSLPRRLHEEIFTSHGLKVPVPKIETISLKLYVRLIETGGLLGFLPRSAVRYGAHENTIKALPIKLLSRPRPVGLIRVKDRTLTPLAERFIDCARKVSAMLDRKPSS